MFEEPDSYAKERFPALLSIERISLCRGKSWSRAALLAAIATAVSLLALPWAPARAEGFEVAIDIQAGVPRLHSLTSTIPLTSGSVEVALELQYDPLGKLLCAGSSTVDGAAATCTGAAKGSGSALHYKLAVAFAGGSVKVVGHYGSGTATFKYSGPKGKAKVVNNPVSLASEDPVTTSIRLLPTVAASGVITGTGTIVSGFGNDSEGTGTLGGRNKGNKISWDLTQGARKVSFAGARQGDEGQGELKIKVPPLRATIGSFHAPSLKPPPATFLGSVSASFGSNPHPDRAPGVKVLVRSDFNGDGSFKGSEVASGLTDVNGDYSVSFAAVSARPLMVDYRLDGYSSPTKVYDSVKAGAKIHSDVLLKPLEVLTVGEGTASSLDGRLRITGLPANVTAVSGRVFNPASESGQFPGEFADDQGSLLVSSVFADIEATDSGGNPITALNSTSDLRMLVPRETWRTMRDLTPGNGLIDVPFYFFDEMDGQWKRSLPDGRLEDGEGAAIAESQLVAVRSGAFAGSIYAAGPISHLSYWNVDWPVETHGCLSGVVKDKEGQPVEGTVVVAVGVTYVGRSEPILTGEDGTFCADVLRSEGPDEDLDGDGTKGQTQQARVEVFSAEKFYHFGPFSLPISQASCEAGGCLAAGEFDPTSAKEVRAEVCPVNGQVVYSGNAISGTSPLNPGDPVPYPTVSAFDESVPPEVWDACLSKGSCDSSAEGGLDGRFQINVPVLNGIEFFATTQTHGSSDKFNSFSGIGSADLCPADPVTIQADYYSFRFLNILLVDDQGVARGICEGFNDLLACSSTDEPLLYGQMSGVRNPPTQAGPWAKMDVFQPPLASPVGTLTLEVTELSPLLGTWTHAQPGRNGTGTWSQPSFTMAAPPSSTPLP